MVGCFKVEVHPSIGRGIGVFLPRRFFNLKTIEVDQISEDGQWTAQVIQCVHSFY